MSRTRPLTAAAALACALCVSSACAGPAEDAQPVTLPSSVVVPPVTTPPPVQPAPTAQGHTDEDNEGVFETPGAYPTWDAASRTAAKTAAVQAMGRFARPEISAQAWWREFAPLLTPAAAQAYAETDPASIPVRRVTGKARIVDDRTPFLARVSVGTDIGDYTVLLSRGGAGDPWLVERLTPPASAQ